MKGHTAIIALTALVALTLTVVGCERDHSDGYPSKEKEEAADSVKQASDLYEKPNEATQDRDKESKALLVAQILNGTWEGSLNILFYDLAGKQYTGQYTMRLFFEQYKRNTLNGTGVEMDYEGDEKIYHAPFTWYVDTNNQAIHMKFSEREMVVDPYQLDENYFSGTMKTTDGLETDQFALVRKTI